MQMSPPWASTDLQSRSRPNQSVFRIWLWNEKYMAFELTHIPWACPHHVFPMYSRIAPGGVTTVLQLGTCQPDAESAASGIAAVRRRFIAASGR